MAKNTKHYLIYGNYYQDNFIGCTSCPSDVLCSGEEPDATLVQVNETKCPCCLNEDDEKIKLPLSEILNKNDYIDGNFEVVQRDFEKVPMKKKIIKAK